jgi:tRNA pseudouridine32 synthase/23S rRNA pseudouridine746 synthase
MIAKSYEAIAPWHRKLTFPMRYCSRLVPGDKFMQMREIDGKPNAETEIDIIEISSSHARYRLSPLTGRKHQLRAHMAALGIGIVNDRIYPRLAPQDEASEPDYSRPLQLLAKSLDFIDPLSGQQRQFESKQALYWNHAVK